MTAYWGASLFYLKNSCVLWLLQHVAHWKEKNMFAFLVGKPEVRYLLRIFRYR